MGRAVPPTTTGRIAARVGSTRARTGSTTRASTRGAAASHGAEHRMNGYATLRRVYVRPPVAESLGSWDAFGWHRPPDPRSIELEHQAFRDRLAEAGAEVVTGVTQVPGDPDAIYAYDPVLVVDGGVIVLRPGKEGRRAEPEAMAHDLHANGVPVLATLEAPATAEGGDIVFLDDATLLAGIAHRTN